MKFRHRKRLLSIKESEIRDIINQLSNDKVLFIIKSENLTKKSNLMNQAAEYMFEFWDGSLTREEAEAKIRPLLLEYKKLQDENE